MEWRKRGGTEGGRAGPVRLLYRQGTHLDALDEAPVAEVDGGLARLGEVRAEAAQQIHHRSRHSHTCCGLRGDARKVAQLRRPVRRPRPLGVIPGTPAATTIPLALGLPLMCEGREEPREGAVRDWRALPAKEETVVQGVQLGVLRQLVGCAHAHRQRHRHALAAVVEPPLGDGREGGREGRGACQKGRERCGIEARKGVQVVVGVGGAEGGRLTSLSRVRSAFRIAELALKISSMKATSASGR